MNKKVKFIIGGMIFVALTKINNLKEQTFGLSALFGFVTAGVLVGLLAYVIFGRDKKAK